MSVELLSHQVILKPLVTEKGTHVSERYNAYAFKVHNQATKPQIREAVETMFEVRVLGVRTQTRKGKLRRHKQRAGYASDWKRAIVTLHEDDKINLF